MPFLRIELTNDASAQDINSFIANARNIIHSVKGDPESMISVFVQTNVKGVFGKNISPSANVHLTSFNMTPEVTSILTRKISGLIQKSFNVAPDCAYIFFWNIDQPHLTGWSGRTFAEILLQQRGNREEFSRRIRGRLVNQTNDPKTGNPVPLAGLRIELWNPKPESTNNEDQSARFLNEGIVGPDGYFELFFAKTVSKPESPPTVLQIRIFEPDQLAIVDGQPLTRRFLAATHPIPDDGVSRDLPIGLVRLPFYEYDTAWSFPYAVPESIRQGFSELQETRFRESEQFATTIGLKIFGELDSTPGGLTIADIQTKFPRNLTQQMETQEKGSSRSDDFFAERLLNNMAPALFRIDPIAKNISSHEDSNIYVIEYNWQKFERRDDLTLLSFRARFTCDKKKLMPLDIDLGLQNEDDPTKYTRFTPQDGEHWDQAKRIVRSHYNNLVGQIQTHLAQVHFNMEQYGIAFLRTVFRNPVRSLLYPFAREILAINEKGRTTLLGGPSIVYTIEPVTRKSIGNWIANTLGRQDWKTWSPRTPLCESHNYAKAAGLYWSILNEFVDKFFANNQHEITKFWSEIVNFSDNLVNHSVPFSESLLEETENSGKFYCLNELPKSKKEGDLSVSNITFGTPSIDDLASLKQVCCYIIFHCTFLHSWTHFHMIDDLGELRYSGMVRNGGMGPEENDDLIAPIREATFALGSTHTLGNMNCGYMLMNEEGDIPSELITRLGEHKSEFESFGFDIERLCARLNT